MRGHAGMAKRPGYRERTEAVMRPVSESCGMSLAEAVRRYRPAA